MNIFMNRFLWSGGGPFPHSHPPNYTSEAFNTNHEYFYEYEYGFFILIKNAIQSNNDNYHVIKLKGTKLKRFKLQFSKIKIIIPMTVNAQKCTTVSGRNTPIFKSYYLHIFALFS